MWDTLDATNPITPIWRHAEAICGSGLDPVGLACGVASVKEQAGWSGADATEWDLYFYLIGPDTSSDTRAYAFGQVVGDSPVGEILRQNGVRIEIHPNDHAPPHAHVKGGGDETRIGQNGKPLRGDPELSRLQKGVVDANRNTIRDAIGRYMSWFGENRD